MAVLIEGLVPGIDGVYRQELTHEGWPVLKNKSGVFCCRFKEKEAWRLNRSGTFKPSSKQGIAVVAAGSAAGWCPRLDVLPRRWMGGAYPDADASGT